MKKRWLTIKPSSIHGNGIFTLRTFKRGDRVGTIRGAKVIYRPLVGGQSNRYADWIGIGPNKWIDPIDEFQYVNHSCNPTCGLSGDRKLHVVAFKDLEEGEEVTIDYSTTESDILFMMENGEDPSTPHYRPIIGPIQSLPREVFQRYMPYIPKAFQRIYEDEVLHGILESHLRDGN